MERGIIISDTIFNKYGFDLIKVEQEGSGFEYYLYGSYRIDTRFTFDGHNYNYRYSIMIQEPTSLLGFNTLFIGYINSEDELKKILEQVGIINN